MSAMSDNPLLERITDELCVCADTSPPRLTGKSSTMGESLYVTDAKEQDISSQIGMLCYRTIPVPVYQ